MSRLRRVPAAAWWCAAIAFVNVAVWGIVTPPLHVPDETSHLSYVQHFAENGEPPNDASSPVFADEQARVHAALLFDLTAGRPFNGTIWSEAQAAGVEAAESADLERGNGGGIQSNSAQPPLYFMVQSVVYRAFSWTDLLDRLMLMRLVGALLAALTTLFTFAFLRELFREPWTWTVGALAVAFQPTLGFISGAVQPDAMLFAASAGLFWMLARTFRRGLTVERGVAIGLLMAAGSLTKLTFLALVPGALLGLALLAWRLRPRIQALPAAGVAVGVLGVALAAYVAANLLFWDRSAFGGGLAVASTSATGGSDGVEPIGLSERIGYIWQLYLPRLPFMNDQFAYFPPYTTWFKGFIGLFGWVDTPFPAWAYRLALGIALPLAALAGWALVQRRGELVRRWPELLTYATMTLGLLVSIGLSGSRYLKDTGSTFEQARYLLPLLPFYAALLSLAALGAGRRFGRPVGAAIVVLAIGHGLFAQLLVIGRFYA